MKTKHRNAAAAKRAWQKDYTAPLRLLGRASAYSPQDLEEKKAPIRASFESLKSGIGTEVDFENLDIALGTTLERAREIDEFFVITAIVARDALGRTWDRYMRLGRFGFDGPGLIAVADGIKLHEQILEKSTPLEMMAAARHAKRVVSVDDLVSQAQRRAA